MSKKKVRGDPQNTLGKSWGGGNRSTKKTEERGKKRGSNSQLKGVGGTSQAGCGFFRERQSKQQTQNEGTTHINVKENKFKPAKVQNAISIVKGVGGILGKEITNKGERDWVNKFDRKIG